MPISRSVQCDHRIKLQVYASRSSRSISANVEPRRICIARGVPLVTLIDLSDVWIHFNDFARDLVKV